MKVGDKVRLKTSQELKECGENSDWWNGYIGPTEKIYGEVIYLKAYHGNRYNHLTVTQGNKALFKDLELVFFDNHVVPIYPTPFYNEDES